MIKKTTTAVLAASAFGLVGAIPAYAATEQFPDSANSHYSAAINTTIDPYSPVRSSPFKEQGKTYWSTTRIDSVTIDCYEHATHNNDGHVSDNVWYHITSINDPAHGTLNDAWTWGGNVNTQHDPPDGLRNC
jgi:hypothetical protein